MRLPFIAALRQKISIINAAIFILPSVFGEWFEIKSESTAVALCIVVYLCLNRLIKELFMYHRNSLVGVFAVY